MIRVQNNPYTFTRPIEDPDRFVGRSTQLAHCKEIIGKRGCLSMVGGPGSGLTSLLKRLLAADIRQACSVEGERLLILYLDCAELPDPCDLAHALLSHLAPTRISQNVTRWQDSFRQLIRALDDWGQEGRVVLLLDDFEAIGANEKYIEFLDRFRGLTNHAQMTLITATHTELRFCCHMNIVESPFPNMFLVDHLAAFTAEDALELIAGASQASGVDLVPYATDILALCGGIPYLLQMACWRYYQVIADQEPLDRQAVEAFMLAEARPVLERIWQSLDAQEREALRLLSQGATPERLGENLVRRGYSDGSGICSTVLATYVARMG